MRADLYPLQGLLATSAVWVSRYQQDVFAYRMAYVEFAPQRPNSRLG